MMRVAERDGIPKEQIMKDEPDFAANLKACWYTVVDADSQQISRPVRSGSALCSGIREDAWAGPVCLRTRQAINVLAFLVGLRDRIRGD
jgi:hypothetical protein